ncbi:hypothetical protein [Glycomyces salinus]|uniref:hypothetical protein n=1 Tax=Glycomyces salinus TaxID=980294 RepID=UPI0018EBACB4|nr:hypothetical protein [Glycomyces salinus]
MTDQRDTTETERRSRRLSWADWVMALVLPPIAMGSVVAALWYDAFLRDSDESSSYGISAGVLGLLWYSVFAFIDWARHKRRAGALLSMPLVVAGTAFGIGIYDLALDYRGEVEDCEVLGSETYRVDARFGTHWETAYDLDCAGQEVLLEKDTGEPPPEEPDFDVGLDCCTEESEHVRVEYDPRGLVGARAGDEGGDPWAWLNAGMIAFGLGVVLRLIVRPSSGT